MPIQTVFLDADGVLVNPNWSGVSEALSRHGVAVSAASLTATASALAELHTYHQTHNLWETVPDEVLLHLQRCALAAAASSSSRTPTERCTAPSTGSD